MCVSSTYAYTTSCTSECQCKCYVELNRNICFQYMYVYYQLYRYHFVVLHAVVDLSVQCTFSTSSCTCTSEFTVHVYYIQCTGTCVF